MVERPWIPNWIDVALIISSIQDEQQSIKRAIKLPVIYLDRKLSFDRNVIFTESVFQLYPFIISYRVIVMCHAAT